MNYFKYLTTLLTIVCVQAFAVPRAINFQANIRKPDGSRLEASDVSYRFKYLNADGTCTVYIEEFNNISMVGTGGNVSFKMGTGTKVFPSASVTLYETFNNDTSNVYACSEGGSYSPLSSNERRNLSVEFFYTGSGGVQTLNGIEINSVPYALHANEAEDAQKLGGFDADLYTKFSNFTTCTGGQVLTYNGTIFSCVSPGAAATFTGVLAGDVSGTQSATVVDTVGGKTAAQVSASVDDTTNATAAATASRIVKRDGSGNASFNTAQANNFSGRNLLLYEATNTNHVQVQAPATFTSGDYVLTLPASKGLSGQVLSTDGNGVTSWIPASTGSVTDVTAGAPLVSSGGATPNITMPAATAAVDGYLSAADFTTFNSKVSSQWTNNGADIFFNTGRVGIGTNTPTEALDVAGNIKITPGAQILANGASLLRESGASTYVGNGAIQTTNAGGAVSLFVYGNGGNVGVGTVTPAHKLDVVGDVNVTGNFKINGVNIASGTVTNVAATLPLTSTGGATPTIAMPAAATAQDGYLTSADWNTFNNKQAAGSYITALTGDVVAAGPGSSAATIQANAITTSKINNLAVTDAKINDVAFGKITGKPTTVAGYGITDAVTNVTAGAPLVSSGGTTPNITMPAATAAVDGYLSAANFTTFNNKVSSQWTNNAADIYFNTGNVGIGTNTPAAALDVNGVILANAIASTSYVFKSPGDTDGGMTSTADGVVQFLANGAERMRITPGAVGIGTTTPAAALDVNGGILADSVQATSFSFKSPGDTDGGLRSNADGVVQFVTNSTERMRLDGSGNLGVGTTSAAYKVDVVGDVNVTGNFKINGVNIASGTVSSVGATLPLTSTGGANPTIAMPAAATAQDGYLTAANWNTFNNKLSSTLAPGNVFVGNGSSVATGVALSGDVASVSNTGSVTLASTVTAGTVGSASAVPTITYDAKGRITGTSSNAYQDATGVSKGIVQAGTNISVTGGVISVPTANGVVAGVLSAADYNTFNGKVSSQWGTSGSDIYYSTGKVGIGNTTPITSGYTHSPLLTVNNAAGIVGQTALLVETGRNSADTPVMTVGFKNSVTNVFTNYFEVSGNGRVGIGTTTPSTALDVVGDVNVTGNFKINGVNIASGTVGGTGTTNKVSKFTASGTIGDSNITDNGTTVTISTDATINGVSIGRGAASLSSNTVLGNSALSANTTGSNNVAVGTMTLQGNTSGNANVANGFMTMNQNTTGYSNVAIGSQALQYNTTGNNNTAIGDHALVASTTASNNTAIGSAAMSVNTTGANNTVTGYGVLQNNTTGSNHTALGLNALRFNTSGNNSTALGYTALTNVTTGNNNTGVGYQAGSSITTGSNNVVIGSNNGSTIATTDNNIIISDGSGFIRQQIDSSGRVGIGMAPTIYALSVNGDINIPAGSNFKINGVNIGTGTVTGTGTTNAIPKFTAAGAIGDSNITDNGTTVTVATDASINGVKIGRGAASVASNTAVGANTLNSNTTGSDNIAVGQQALMSNTTGADNVAVGYQSMLLNTTGNYNVASGMNSLRSNTGGHYNTANGTQSLNGNTTGSWNTAMGASALQSNTTGNNNVAVGGLALTANTTGNSNVAVGYGSLNSNSTASGNVATGYFAMTSNTTGNSNTATGYYALYANSTGANNTASGNSALQANTTGNDNVATGYRALYTNTTGNYNIATGTNALYANTTGSNNIAMGYYSLSSNTTGSSNVAVGISSLASNTTGNYNAAYGSYSLVNNTTGNNNTSVGYYSLNQNTSGTDNVATGYYTLRFNTTGSYNTASGQQSMTSNTTGTGNVATGYRSLASNTSGGANTALGGSSMEANSTGYANAAVGSNSMQSNTTGYVNTAIGADALKYNTIGSHNSAVGFAALTANTSGIGNVATGYYALTSNTTASYNTATGNESLRFNITGMMNTASGYLALSQNTSGDSNTASGYNAANNNTIGTGNVAFGHSSLYSGKTKSESTAIGYNSMYYADDVIAAPAVSYNTAVGAYSLYGSFIASNNTGLRNTALGHSALRVVSSGSNNIGVGYNSGSAITTGSNNVVIGSNTGSTIATSSNNILVADGAGNIRIQVDSSGQVGMGVAPTQALDVVGNIKASGCIYYNGGSTGVCASDERLKENVHAFDLGLETLLGINPVNFKYNGKAGLKFNDQEQLGVIAQDLEKTAPSLVKRQMVQMNPEDKQKTEIKVVDYGAFTYVMINAIKDLYHKWFTDSVEIHRKLASVEQENIELKKKNEEIQKRLDRIEQMLNSK